MSVPEIDITDAVVYMVRKHPFFANLVMNMTRNFTVKIPTVGVNVTEQVNLHINPYFWQSLMLEEQVDVLKHECYHVINNHFSRFRDLEPTLFDDREKNIKDRIFNMMDAKNLNIAADAAINDFLPKIPKKMKFFDKDGNMVTKEDGTPIEGEPVTVEGLRKTFKDLEHKRPLEYYYDHLKEMTEEQKQQMQCQTCEGTGKVDGDQDGDGEGEQEEQQGQGKGQGEGEGDGQEQSQGGGNGHSHGDNGKPCPDCGGHGANGMVTVDDHSIWSEGNQDHEYVTEKIKSVVDKAVEQSGGREAGNIPYEVLQAIEALNHKPKDWRSDLQRFVSRASESFRLSTRKKRNRRYGTLYPGIKRYPKLTLACLFDASGSVDDEEAAQFFAEIGRIHNNNVKVTIVEFDTQVNAIYEYDPKKKPQLHGRGGTSFKPAFDAAKKLEVDGIICFTDGGDWGNDVDKPKIPVLWALVGERAEEYLPYKWGARTVVKVNKRKAA